MTQPLNGKELRKIITAFFECTTCGEIWQGARKKKDKGRDKGQLPISGYQRSELAEIGSCPLSRNPRLWPNLQRCNV